MTETNKWFILAEILAILSGTWMVGAGMFLSAGMINLGQSQDNLRDLGSSYGKVCGNTDSLINVSFQLQNLLFNISQNAVRGNLRMVETSVYGFQLLSKTAIAFAFLSIFSWYWGSYGAALLSKTIDRIKGA